MFDSLKVCGRMFLINTWTLSTKFATLETVVTGFMDEFPKFFRNRKPYLTLAISIVAFLLGLILVTEVT